MMTEAVATALNIVFARNTGLKSGVTQRGTYMSMARKLKCDIFSVT